VSSTSSGACSAESPAEDQPPSAGIHLADPLSRLSTPLTANRPTPPQPHPTPHLIRRVAGGIDLVDGIKLGVPKRHVHEVALDQAAGVGDARPEAVVVVEAAADLVAVVVEAWGVGFGRGWGGR